MQKIFLSVASSVKGELTNVRKRWLKFCVDCKAKSKFSGGNCEVDLSWQNRTVNMHSLNIPCIHKHRQRTSHAISQSDPAMFSLVHSRTQVFARSTTSELYTERPGYGNKMVYKNQSGRHWELIKNVKNYLIHARDNHLPGQTWAKNN